MKLQPAICTQCQATLSVDASKKTVVCPYCQTSFIVETGIEAFNNIHIQKAVINAGSVIINGPSNADFDIRDGVLVKYNRRATEIVIPEGVYRIENGAFDDAFNPSKSAHPIMINKLVIPGSMKTFSYQGYSLNTKELILSEGVEELLKSAVHADAISFPKTIKRVQFTALVNSLHVSENDYIEDLKPSKNYTLKTLRCPNGFNDVTRQIYCYYNKKCFYCGSGDGFEYRLFKRPRCRYCGKDLIFYFKSLKIENAFFEPSTVPKRG